MPHSTFPHLCGGLKSVCLPHHTIGTWVLPASASSSVFLTPSSIYASFPPVHCVSPSPTGVFRQRGPGLPSALFIYLWLNLSGSLRERDTVAANGFEDTIHWFMCVSMCERGRVNITNSLIGGGGNKKIDTVGLLLLMGFVSYSLTNQFERGGKREGGDWGHF